LPRELLNGDRSGNAWLICFLPLAVSFRERLLLRAAVDPVLIKNATELMRIWATWDPGLKPVKIESEPRDVSPQPNTSKTACFFTGGVDSFFTVLHPGSANSKGQPTGAGRVDDLVYVWGYDLPLDRPEEFAKLNASLSTAAAEMGKRFHTVATNLRQTQYRRMAWGRLSHGCALGAVAHFLAGSFSGFLISASHKHEHDFAWGSHLLTDPLMSSSHLAIKHYGAEFDRVEKTEFIAQHAVALRHLRVCYRARRAANCGNCGKCYRTMLALEMLGQTSKTSAFPASVLDLRKARRMLVEDENTSAFLSDVLRHAIARNRPDIAGAIRASQRWNRWRNSINSLASRFERIPGITGVLRALSRQVQRGALE
jgi:hypothetical protein